MAKKKGNGMKDLPAKGKRGGNWHFRRAKPKQKMRRRF